MLVILIIPIEEAVAERLVFHHRYHVVWITKYRSKCWEGALQEWIHYVLSEPKRTDQGELENCHFSFRWSHFCRSVVTWSLTCIDQ
jgi:hypothetical protein